MKSEEFQTKMGLDGPCVARKKQSPFFRLLILQEKLYVECLMPKCQQIISAADFSKYRGFLFHEADISQVLLPRRVFVFSLPVTNVACEIQLIKVILRGLQN